MSSNESAVTLRITGMTCASCANRIERRLNRVDGVEASVNFATEHAHVVAAQRTRTARVQSVREGRVKGSRPSLPLEQYAGRYTGRFYGDAIVTLDAVAAAGGVG